MGQIHWGSLALGILVALIAQQVLAKARSKA